MAIFTAIGCDVTSMVKNGTSRLETDFFYRMTSDAAVLDTENRFTIMTCSAGLTLFHISHTESLTIFSRMEDTVMTVDALEQLPMILVAEQSYAGFLGRESYRYRGFMTLFTITSYTESSFAFMACAA